MSDDEGRPEIPGLAAFLEASLPTPEQMDALMNKTGELFVEFKRALRPRA